ncbi:MAG: DUF488 domain-containing protein [Lachnospiraceae bacterium]|nr:DUF488 domain-containing protein [Lachnospiraceae bacterium]
MIQILHVNDLNPSVCHEAWVVMRTRKYMKPGYYHVPELSPSWDLFSTYQQLYKSGRWNREVFDSIYLPRFLEEMKTKEARSYLNYLWKQDKAGVIVQIGCSCQDETMCHRSIVGGLLEGVGANVCYTTGNSYKHYYDMYKL